MCCRSYPYKTKLNLRKLDRMTTELKNELDFTQMCKEAYYKYPNTWHIYKNHYGVTNEYRDGYKMVTGGFYPEYYPPQFYEYSLSIGRFPLMYMGGFSLYVGLELCYYVHGYQIAPYPDEDTFWHFENIPNLFLKIN